MLNKVHVLGEKRFRVQEVLDWELSNTNLRFALTDAAEEALNLVEVECDALVTIEGNDFVVIFQEDTMKKAKFTDYIKDWQYEVANGDTVLGFKEWLEHKEEANQPQLVQVNGWQSDGLLAR